MKTLKVPLLGLLFIGLFGSPAHAALFDHSVFDEVLHRYVDQDGLVDYAAIRQNSLSALDSYFERMAESDLNGWSYTERLAFWIDAYNARVLYVIAHKPYMKKVSEDFELFNRPYKIAGEMVSLNDIEFRILRGTTNPDNKKGPIRGLTLPKRDPRVCFALVRGTVSGPRLRNFAYTAENVEDALDEDAALFVNNSKNIEIINYKLKLNSLLKWDAKDFEPVGGVAAYLSGLLNADKRGDADAVKQMLTTDLKKAVYEFDWTVNAVGSNLPDNP